MSVRYIQVSPFANCHAFTRCFRLSEDDCQASTERLIAVTTFCITDEHRALNCNHNILHKRMGLPSQRAKGCQVFLPLRTRVKHDAEIPQVPQLSQPLHKDSVHALKRVAQVQALKVSKFWGEEVRLQNRPVELEVQKVLKAWEWKALCRAAYEPQRLQIWRVKHLREAVASRQLGTKYWILPPSRLLKVDKGFATTCERFTVYCFVSSNTTSAACISSHVRILAVKVLSKLEQNPPLVILQQRSRRRPLALHAFPLAKLHWSYVLRSMSSNSYLLKRLPDA